MVTLEKGPLQLFGISPGQLHEYSRWAQVAHKHAEEFRLSGMSQASILTLNAIAGLVENHEGAILGERLKLLSGIVPERQNLIYRFYVQSTLGPICYLSLMKMLLSELTKP